MRFMAILCHELGMLNGFMLPQMSCYRPGCLLSALLMGQGTMASCKEAHANVFASLSSKPLPLRKRQNFNAQ